MSNSILNLTVDMYADDTLIYFCHQDVKTFETCLNDDLASLSKTKVMLPGTSAKISKTNHMLTLLRITLLLKKVNTFKGRVHFR